MQSGDDGLAHVSERLRILILPEWYPSESDPVAGAFVRDQARAVARLHDVTVLTPKTSSRRRGGPETDVDDGVKTLRVPTRARPGSTAARIELVLGARRLLRDMRRRGDAVDIVHAHVFSAGFLALLAARGSYPVVVSEHLSDFVAGTVHGRAARVAHYVLRHADMVCPVSRELESHLARFEPRGRYQVVPNVVDVEAFVGQAKHPPREGRPARLLVVATLAPVKGVDFLLRALAEVCAARTDFSLDVVGDGPSQQALEQLASERLPDGVVTFHGAQPRAEVAAFMGRSDALMLPSTIETFGVVLVEALAAGLPVITTSAVPDHGRIDGRFGIVVPPRDVTALRDAVLAFLERGWSFPYEAALEWARSFAQPVVSRRWDEIYRALTRESSMR